MECVDSYQYSGIIIETNAFTNKSQKGLIKQMGPSTRLETP